MKHTSLAYIVIYFTKDFCVPTLVKPENVILAYQVKKYIGSYSAAMNGLDAIIFTAGMGENNPELRERACADMEFFGIKIDKEVNAKTLRQPNTVLISTPDSKVKVYVLPTNEELMIARDTEACVNKAK
jgi:acetate kinase